MLVTVENHVLETTQAKWPQVTELIRSPAVVQVVLVSTFVHDGQFDATFFRLLVEDCQDLLANFS